MDDEELTIQYQPQIDLRTNRVVGLEALAQWSHHRRGRVAPAGFIAVAERMNLIVPPGIWVLRQACLQARVWLDQGLLPDVMAITSSPLQFKLQQLVADVRARWRGDAGVIDSKLWRRRYKDPLARLRSAVFGSP